MGLNEDISAMLYEGSTQQEKSAAQARIQQRTDDRNNQKVDHTIMRAAASGLVGAAIAKTLFGNRGS